MVAGIGPGSSNADYDAVGIDFAERWQRLDEAARLLRHVLRGAPLTGPTRHYPAPPAPLSPAPFRADGVPRVDRELGVSGRPASGGRATATAGWPRRTTPIRPPSPPGGPSSRPSCRPPW